MKEKTMSTDDKKTEESVNIKCRSPRGCDSIEAVVIRIPRQDAQRLYKCAKCNHTWGVNLGGAVNL